MGRVRESLSNGVMTGPDPAMLPPGTLSYMRNAVYTPSTLALQRARGRAVFGVVTAFAGDINGIRDIQFDNGDHYLVAQASCAGSVDNYSTATVEGAGTFGVLTAGITATTALEVVHYSNRFYTMNGAVGVAAALGPNTNLVLYLSSTAANSPLTFRQHGMSPVVATNPTATAIANFSLTVSGFYEYWTTEVIKYVQDGQPQEIESGFSGTPMTIFVDVTSHAPVIQMPALANASATHWRVYRSPVKAFSTDRVYPDGIRVNGDGATIGVTSFTDTDTSTVGSYVFGGGVWGSTGWGGTLATITAANLVYASATGGPASPWGPLGNAILVTGFAFGGFKGPVLGIEVRVSAYATAGTNGAQAQVILAKKGVLDGNDPKFKFWASNPQGTRSFTVTSTTLGTPDVVTIGGSTDRWVAPDLPGFVDTDFDNNLVLGFIAYGPLAIDAAQVRVYYGAGMSAASIIPYPTVIYTFGDAAPVEVAKNGPPPTCNTGDIFADSLVTNSLRYIADPEPKLIRYSYPGEPDAFPNSYYLGFNTKDNDFVTLVKRVNNTLVVGCLHSLWRVNYLPTERDASFDRGVATEPISKQYGVVNPMCACTFSVDGGPERLAYVSQKGIHVTDGFHMATQTSNMNWRGILDNSGNTSTPIALVNDPENQELLFYYRNDALTPETYMCLHLNYSLTHVGTLHQDVGPSRTFEEALKISGPVHMRNYDSAAGGTTAGVKSAWAVPRLNGDTTIFLGYGVGSIAAGAGKVYKETGTNIPALDPNMRFRTRRMYLAGEANEFRLNECYGYIGSYTSAGGPLGIDMNTQTVKTNDDAAGVGEVTQTAKTQAYGGRRLGKWQFRQVAEGLILSAAVTGNPQNSLAWEYLMLDGENFGQEDSGL